MMRETLRATVHLACEAIAFCGPNVAPPAACSAANLRGMHVRPTSVPGVMLAACEIETALLAPCRSVPIRKSKSGSIVVTCHDVAMSGTQPEQWVDVRAHRQTITFVTAAGFKPCAVEPKETEDA